MAKLSFTRLLLSIPIVLTAFAPVPVNAKTRDLASYPLRIQIFQSDWSSTGSFYGHGSGQANLIDGQSVHGFDFAYECPIHYMQSVGNQAYPAKWKKPERTIEILASKVGNQGQSDACEFRITLHDFAYDMQNGTLSTFTQEQYKVRIGAALPKSGGPVDSDASHYALRLSVLQIDWSPPINGSRTASGRGNLRTQSGLSSLDFSTDCGAAFPISPPDRYYAGRWIVEGSLMVLLLHVNSGESLLCTLKATAHTDIYVLDPSGAVRAVSQEDYRRTH